MKGSEEKQYFKVGVFVICSFALLIVLLLIFAGGHWFSRTIKVETYFNESVQGLTVGSPVKYRGITIGKVTRITFVGDVYHFSKRGSKYARYIYVLFSINPSQAGYEGHIGQLHQFITKQVEDGLRVKMVLQDLTGNVYLELNFNRPDNESHQLPVVWQPQHIYIPSTESVLTRFADNIQNILNGLKDVNFKQFFTNIQDVAKSTNDAMKNVNNILVRSKQSVIQTSKNMDAISKNLRGLTSELSANPSSILFDKPQQIDPSQL